MVPGRDEIPTIVVPAPQIAEVARVLRDHPALQFNVCLDVTAADYFPRAPRFDVIYHLVSLPRTLTLRVKVIVDDEDRGADGLDRVARRPTGRSAKSGTCSGSCSPGIRISRAC